MRRKFILQRSHKQPISPLLISSFNCSSSGSDTTQSSSERLSAGQWEELTRPKMSKKLAPPPPPVFSFAKKTTSTSNDDNADSTQQQQQQQSSSSSSTSTLDKFRFSGGGPRGFSPRGTSEVFSPHQIFSEVPHFSPEYNKVIQYKKISVWDVLAEMIMTGEPLPDGRVMMANGTSVEVPSMSSTATLGMSSVSSSSSSSSSTSDSAKVANLIAAARVFKATVGSANNSARTGTADSLFDHPSIQQQHQHDDSFNNSSDFYANSSPFVQGLKSLTALRNPEDIILVLRPYLQKTGKVEFGAIPSHIVRQLVGHDGFGKEPSLVVSSSQKTKTEDEKEKSSSETIDEDVLEAVTRVIAPTGVLAVDKKRRVIKMKPGVSQLAARIDAAICELNGPKGVMKKVQFGAIYQLLTGTEKAFVRDVGGLSRIALCFPLQFAMPKDLLGVQKQQQPIGLNNASSNAGSSVASMLSSLKDKTNSAQNNAFVKNSQQEEDPSSKQKTTLETANEDSKLTSQQKQEMRAPYQHQQQQHFHQGVANFREAERQRLSRVTTGESLVKTGESIFADEDEDE